eukprot:scaffold1130_cov195-Pinguiococcus_pyrenoidosus.AAC.54
MERVSEVTSAKTSDPPPTRHMEAEAKHGVRAGGRAISTIVREAGPLTDSSAEGEFLAFREGSDTNLVVPPDAHEAVSSAGETLDASVVNRTGDGPRDGAGNLLAHAACPRADHAVRRA